MLLIGGKQDILASEGDYCWLYQVLLCNNSRTILWNLNFGHCSLVYPEASREGANCDKKVHITKLVEYINEMLRNTERAFKQFKKFEECKNRVVKEEGYLS